MIKIILLGRHTYFAFFKHIAAIITDVETGRTFLLNHPFGSYDQTDARAHHPDKAMQLYQKAEPNFCVGTATLYSGRSYDDFLVTFQQQFPREFTWTTNNCSTAVLAMLDFFCPVPVIESYSLWLKLLSAPYFLLAHTLGDELSSWRCGMSLVDTPAEVFEKAEARLQYYGAHTLPDESLTQARHPRRPLTVENSRPDKLDEWAMKTFLRPFGMI